MKLTPTQQKIVDLVCEGHNNESIGNQLGITVNTVKVQMWTIFTKTGCGSRLELALKFIKERHAAEMKQLREEYGIFEIMSN